MPTKMATNTVQAVTTIQEPAVVALIQGAAHRSEMFACLTRGEWRRSL